MFYDEIPQKEKQGDDTPAWMLTFADLVSLLICFFVLLYSMKAVDEEIWQDISGSFAGALSSSQKFKKMNANNNSGVDVERILTSDSMDYMKSVIIAKFAKEGLLEYSEIFKEEANSNLHIVIPAVHLFDEQEGQFTEKGIKILNLISSCILYVQGELEVRSYVESDPEITNHMQKSLERSLMVRSYFKSQGIESPIKVMGGGSLLYEKMKDVYSTEELSKKTVKLDVIIKSKVF
ncbi:MAG: hypothetical protein GY793_00890 [Proteobacteria bacterium]|nr:hypothetical protein [Pseudomonadota bacterium]